MSGFTDITILGLPILYLLGPIFLFGPILVFVAYSLGVGTLFTRRAADAPETEGARDRRRARENRQIRDRAWFLGGRTRRAPTIGHYAVQFLLFGAFAVFIAGYSDWPPYRVLGSDEAVVKLSMSYPAERKEACRKLSREEMQKLPPNMRAPTKCTRARWSAEVTLWLADEVVFQKTVSPSGLSDDGPSIFYKRLAIPAGDHHIRARIHDIGGTRRAHEMAAHVTVEAGQVLIIGFDENARKITLR